MLCWTVILLAMKLPPPHLSSFALLVLVLSHLGALQFSDARELIVL